MPDFEPLISHEELRARLADRALTVVDVLPAESYASGHIPGTISLPLAEMRERVGEVLPDRAREVVAYCAAFT